MAAMESMKSPWWLWIDVAVVVGFVVLGRRTHEEAETFAGVLRTAAPFMLGLLAGWTLFAAWRRPAGLRVGLGVTAATLAIGMLLRNVVFAEGTAGTFIVVAGLFLTLGLVGWRLLAGWLVGRRGRDAVPVGGE
jgi:hypothetical protein